MNVLTFHGTKLNAVDQLLLENEKHDRAGQHHIDTDRHLHVCVRISGRRTRKPGVYADRQSVYPFIAQIQQRPHKIVPVPHERLHHDQNDHGHTHGQHDPPEYHKCVCAVDLCRLVHLAGNAAHELPDQENIDRAAAEKCRDRKGKQRIDPPYLYIGNIERYLRANARQHHRAEHEREQRFAETELHLGKAESAQCRGKRHADHLTNLHDQRVYQIPDQLRIPSAGKIAPINFGRHDVYGIAVQDVCIRHQTARNHYEERKQKEHTEQDQKEIFDRQAYPFADAHLTADRRYGFRISDIAHCSPP